MYDMPQANVEATHQQAHTSLGHQGRAAPHRQAIAIPEGYVMLPSGILVPMEALQNSQTAASLGMLQQPQHQVVALPSDQIPAA